MSMSFIDRKRGHNISFVCIRMVPPKSAESLRCSCILLTCQSDVTLPKDYRWDSTKIGYIFLNWSASGLPELVCVFLLVQIGWLSNQPRSASVLVMRQLIAESRPWPQRARSPQEHAHCLFSQFRIHFKQLTASRGLETPFVGDDGEVGLSFPSANSSLFSTLNPNNVGWVSSNAAAMSAQNCDHWRQSFKPSTVTVRENRLDLTFPCNRSTHLFVTVIIAFFCFNWANHVNFSSAAFPLSAYPVDVTVAKNDESDTDEDIIIGSSRSTPRSTRASSLRSGRRAKIFQRVSDVRRASIVVCRTDIRCARDMYERSNAPMFRGAMMFHWWDMKHERNYCNSLLCCMCWNRHYPILVHWLTVMLWCVVV